MFCILVKRTTIVKSKTSRVRLMPVVEFNVGSSLEHSKVTRFADSPTRLSRLFLLPLFGRRQHGLFAGPLRPQSSTVFEQDLIPRVSRVPSEKLSDFQVGATALFATSAKATPGDVSRSFSNLLHMARISLQDLLEVR
jgi:hypothetical protein